MFAASNMTNIACNDRESVTPDSLFSRSSEYSTPKFETFDPVSDIKCVGVLIHLFDFEQFHYVTPSVIILMLKIAGRLSSTVITYGPLFESLQTQTS